MQTRRLCRGTWNITHSNITLIKADIQNPTNDDQSVVQNMSSALSLWFTGLLPEYNCRWYPRDDAAKVNTFPPLVASILWTRMIAKWGLQSGDHFLEDACTDAHVRYVKAARVISITQESITLKQSRLLLLVLAINPVLTILAVVAKAFLYSTLIDEGFGLISLLSGVKKDSLDILQGVALSGTLKRGVMVHFNVSTDADEGRPERVQVVLDALGPSGTLNSKTLYG